MVDGIDVSRHQGAIDWKQAAASGIRFALIRAGYGNDVSQKDARFEANLNGALAAGLDAGVYWFSYAVGEDDARREAEVFRKIISPYREKIVYPAAFDYEAESMAYASKHGAAPSAELVNRIANTFLGEMKKDGWRTALYTNNDFRKRIFSPQTLAAWDVWLADYSGGPDAPCAIWQKSSAGRVPGIAGEVDLDVCCRDYAAEGAPTSVRIDTTGTYTMAPGSVYQLKTTCPGAAKVWSGNSRVVLVLPRCRSGCDDLWYLVAVGRAGDGAGIYAAGPGEQGRRRLVVNLAGEG